MTLPDEFRSSRVRLGIVVVGCALLFAVVAVAFWREDLRYSLPTPRPAALVEPPLGTRLPVNEWLAEAGLVAGARPVLLHFFNPDCPCSRFNVEHLRKLHARFGDRVLFVAAAQSSRLRGDLQDKIQSLGLGIPAFLDEKGRRAAAAGVYSTPQAVLVDAERRIVFRGNYNTSRYCTDPRTEFVRIALERLVERGDAPVPPSIPAYGCELPSAEGPLASRTN